MLNPVLSIVVPTHNRAVYAISCIEAILAFSDADLQLVVTDTSTDHELERLLHRPECSFLADPRLVYVKIEEPSNLTKNHNAAMELAEGEYVCLIGDDDCITQGAIEAARWALEHDVSVVSQNITTTYAWPDFKSLLARAGHAGRLYVPRRAGGGRWRDARGDLRAALARALQGTDQLPRCYHGVVRRDLLRQIQSEAGAFFSGSSPDMSGAVALACSIERYYETDLPLTIPGVSGGSNSGRSAMNTHKGALTSETQTSGFENAGWIEGVPKFFSVETVWAHAGLVTLEKLDPSLLTQFNYARLLALCSLRHPDFQIEVDNATGRASTLLGRDLTQAIAREKRKLRIQRLFAWTKRLMIPTISGGRKYLPDKDNIAEASKAYQQYASDLDFHFSPE